MAGAESDWQFNAPTDIAFGNNGDLYIADGYGNSRVVKFDQYGNFIKAWGSDGSGRGEFDLAHSIVVDKAGRVYVGDREQCAYFKFSRLMELLSKQWTGIGYPYGLFLAG